MEVIILWSQDNGVYICKIFIVLQTKIKVLRKHVPFVNKNKELQKKMKYCKKKISFANKNKDLQKKMKYCDKKNISFANKIKNCEIFCNTYFPWPHLLIYLLGYFYFAFQSNVSYTTPLRLIGWGGAVNQELVDQWWRLCPPWFTWNSNRNIWESMRRTWKQERKEKQQKHTKK